LHTISHLKLNELSSKKIGKERENEDQETKLESTSPKKHETGPSSSPSSCHKTKKLSIKIPKNKDLEYKMNVKQTIIF